jgi:hypothetical protein
MISGLSRSAAACSVAKPAPAKAGVVDREKGIVVLAEANLRPVPLLFDETVAVEVIGGLERKERGHPHAAHSPRVEV